MEDNAKMKENILSSIQNSATIPEHLIVDDILPRLPVKSLVRFKSVSKSWFSTISTPEFAKTHLNLNQSSDQVIITAYSPVHRSYKLMLMLDNPDESSNFVGPVEMGFNLDRIPFQQRFPSETFEDVDLVGSCNGLLCFCYTSFPKSNYNKSFFVVCNPATRQYHEITCSNTSTHDYDHRYRYINSWFGYIPSIDDYKIFTVSPPKLDLHVFSLRTGKWHVISHSYRDIPLQLPRVRLPAVVDDILYWAVAASHVLGFELVNERLKEFPRMDWLNRYDTADFFSMNDRTTSLCCYSSSTRDFDVWILKQSNDWNSWEKSFSFDLGHEGLLHISPTGKFIALNLKKLFSEDTVDLLMHGHYSRFSGINILTEITLLDPSKDIIQQCPWNFHALLPRTARFYVESLVSPFGTIKTTEEEDCEV